MNKPDLKGETSQKELKSLRQKLGSWFYYSLVVAVTGDLVLSTIFIVLWSRTPNTSRLDLFLFIQVVITLFVLAGSTVGIVQTSLEDQRKLDGSASALRWALYSLFEQLAIKVDSLVLAHSSSLQFNHDEGLKVREQRERINRLIMQKAQIIVPYSVEVSSNDEYVQRKIKNKHNREAYVAEKTTIYGGIVGLSGLSIFVVAALLTWFFRYLTSANIQGEALWRAFGFAALCGLFSIVVTIAALLRMRSHGLVTLVRMFGAAMGVLSFISGLVFLAVVGFIRYPIIIAAQISRVMEVVVWLVCVVVGAAIAVAAVQVARFMLSLMRHYVGCGHKHLSFPVTIPWAGGSGNRPSDAHVTCLDCGAEFMYDWHEMKTVVSAKYQKGGVAARKEVPASANDQG